MRKTRLWQDIAASRAPGAAFVTMGILWAGFAAQVPVLKDQIGASDATFGAIFLVASLGAISAMWLAPVAERHLGARGVQLVSGALGLAFVLVAFPQGAVGFALIFLAISALSGVADILMNARISEIEEATRRPLMNLNHALFSFAYAGAAVLTGLAREAGFGPLAVFGAMAVVVVICALGMYAPPRRIAPAPGDAVAVPRNPVVWLAGLVVLAGFFTEQAVEGWSALHIERTLGGGAAEGALGPAVLGLTMGFGRLFGHALARHLRDISMIAVACLTAAGGAVAAALAPTVLLAYLGFGLLGVGISVVLPLTMAIVGRAVPPERRVKAIGQASVIGYGAFLVGPALMGGVAERFSLAVSFLMVAGVLVVVAAVLVPLIARHLSRLETA